MRGWQQQNVTVQLQAEAVATFCAAMACATFFTVAFGFAPPVDAEATSIPQLASWHVRPLAMTHMYSTRAIAYAWSLHHV